MNWTEFIKDHRKLNYLKKLHISAMNGFELSHSWTWMVSYISHWLRFNWSADSEKNCIRPIAAHARLVVTPRNVNDLNKNTMLKKCNKVNVFESLKKSLLCFSMISFAFSCIVTLTSCRKTRVFSPPHCRLVAGRLTAREFDRGPPCRRSRKYCRPD